MCFILFVVPFKVHFVAILRKLLQLHTFTGIFVQTFHVWNIIIRLYRAAHECRHFQVPMPKTQEDKHPKDQQLPLSVPPPKEEYLEDKEYLPRDIINILELLGKADNIPFNQLYNLAEDCVDRYYTKVIKP